MSAHPLRFMDCNCGVGPRWGGPGPGYDGSVSTLLHTMDSLGIAEACPFALSEIECDPGVGNSWLASTCAENERLHPVWVMGLHYCGEYPTPKRLPTALAQFGVKMVRVPLGKTTSLKQFDLCLLEGLLACLAQHHIPLLLDCLHSTDQIQTSEMKALLETWPGLPVILSFPKLEQDDRRFYYFWERFDRFHVELSGYQTLGGIEAVTQRFGSNRLVFGSRFPHFTPLQSMLQVIYSGVEESVKRDIAGGTMRRLLCEVAL